MKKIILYIFFAVSVATLRAYDAGARTFLCGAYVNLKKEERIRLAGRKAAPPLYAVGGNGRYTNCMYSVSTSTAAVMMPGRETMRCFLRAPRSESRWPA